MSARRTDEPWAPPYSILLTQSQRLRLLQLGGPQWVREQIDKTLATKDTNGSATPRPAKQPVR